MYLSLLLCISLSYNEGPEGVKWELRLAGFALWENGVQATLGLGFSHWELEKNVKNQEKKWEWDLRIAKWDLEKK